MATLHRASRPASCAALALLALVLSCSSGTEPAANAAAIQVLPASVRLSPGDSLFLVVSAFDAQGTLLPGATATYESNSPSVVTVSGSGMLRALGLGTATVTVTVGPMNVGVPVTVFGAPWAVQVTPARVRLLAGDSLGVSAAVVDAAGSPLTGLTATFTSLNAAVASVTTLGAAGGTTVGVVHAISVGTATIQAASGVLQTPVPVAVYGLQVTPSPFVVAKDSTLQLVVAVQDSAAATVTSPALAFRSADTTVATVTAAGAVRGVKYGSTTVAVTYAGLTRNVIVQVVGGHPAGVLDQTVTLGQRPYGLAISPSGRVYVTQLDGGSVAAGQLPSLAFTGTVTVGAVPTDIDFNSTGTRAYVANQSSRTVGVIDVASGVQLDSIVLPSGDPFVVRVSPDDKTLYVSTNSTGVYAYDLATKNLKTQFAIADAINGLALHPAGNLLYATGMTTGRLYEINLGTGAIRAATVGGTPQDVVVSPDGTILYVADEAGPLQLRSVATGGLLATVPSAASAFSLRLTADGAALWVGSYFNGTVQIVNTATLTSQTVASGVAARRIRFDQQGRNAVITNENGSVLVFK